MISNIEWLPVNIDSSSHPSMFVRFSRSHWFKYLALIFYILLWFRISSVTDIDPIITFDTHIHLRTNGGALQGFISFIIESTFGSAYDSSIEFAYDSYTNSQFFLCRQFYWWTCITGEKSRLEEWNLRLEFQKVYQTSDFHGLNLILIEKQRVLKAIGISDLILQSKQKFRWISMRLKMIRYYLYLNCQSQITVKFLGLDSFKPSLSPSLQRWRSTRCSSSPSGQLPVISKSLDVRVS